MKTITKLEKMALKKIYPSGCRVKLDYLVSVPYSKIIPGDLGTVRKIDDAGIIHVSWDNGERGEVIYQEDKCQCIMTEMQMDGFLRGLQNTPFRNIDELQNCLEDNLCFAFPQIYFRMPVNNELPVELCVDVFDMEQAKISVQFSSRNDGQLCVKEASLMGMRKEKTGVVFNG
ncbi:hypothetical protein K040078D81_43590 [Blautia hominis]|uniref:DUF4314 domain-containing protein n=1 Tax=Blautia hominis TaxID=2025493 RepID=A0ABQ0BFL3_9FIRM